MRVSVVTVDGTPEELASLPEELRSLLTSFELGPTSPSTQGTQEPLDGTIPELEAELRRFIRDRARV